MLEKMRIPIHVSHKMKNESHHKKQPGQFSNRSLARTVVFQLLYLEDMNPDNPEEWTSEYLSEKLPDHDEILKFARQLKAGVQENRAELDEKIGQKSKNWSLARMAVTDRNILRLALYEMTSLKTPKPVVINEAIQLADRFGAAESPAFVNGILDQFGEEGTADEGCEAGDEQQTEGSAAS